MKKLKDLALFLTAVLTERAMRFWEYLFNLLYAIDQLANAFFGGYPDETISSRAGKGALRGNLFWSASAVVIDLIFLPFERDHCFKAIEHDEGDPVDKK